MKDLVVAILGGDMRQVYLANLFANETKEARVFGLKSDKLSFRVKQCGNINEAIQNANIVIGPIPLSKDEITFKTSLSDEAIYMDEVFKIMNTNQLFIGGQITKKIKEKLENDNLKFADILEKNEFAILNAIATAEGAIAEAIQLSDINLHGSKVLVLGFGRCGKIIAEKLKGFDAKVTVEARKAEDIAFSEAYGYEPLYIDDLGENIDRFDFIFNTIPKLIIDKIMLLNVKKSCVIIDIASAPGGVDFEEAKRLGIKAVLSLGIPGKVAPKSSAEIIWKVVSNMEVN